MKCDVDAFQFPPLFPEADRTISPAIHIRSLPHQPLPLYYTHLYQITASLLKHRTTIPSIPKLRSTNAINMVKAGKRGNTPRPSPPVLQVHRDLSKFERDGAHNQPVTPFQPLQIPGYISHIYPPQALYQALCTTPFKPIPPLRSPPRSYLRCRPLLGGIPVTERSHG